MKYLLLPLLLFSLSFGVGEGLYKKYCSSCHGEDRLGSGAPPLFPPLFLPRSDERVYEVIKKGTVGMPSFEYLKEDEIKAIVEFIKRPVDESRLRWDKENIEKSKSLSYTEKVRINNLKDITVMVERGKGLLWLMEGLEALHKVPVPYVHGGIKFSKDGDIYVPSRSGWISKYSPEKGEIRRVRACIYLRNIALSSDGEVLVASCWLPSSLVFLDKDLRLIEIKEMEGRVNAVYELRGGGFVFTFKDRPYVGFLDKKAEITYKRLDKSLEDFTIDPFEEYLIGSGREGIRIYSLKDLKLVKELKALGLPHLASSYFWYSKGEFYFATPLLGKPLLSIWKAYQWEHVKDIPLKGFGFLARSNYRTPYIWVDESSDTFALLDKRSLEPIRIRPVEGKRATHTEFSSDGKLAYLSLEDALIIYDGVSLKKLKEYPAHSPAGKYNFFNKSRTFEPAQLGYQVFMEKCWGCHHTTQQAFGPPLKWSAQRRDKATIMAHILDPASTYKLLGYTRNAMPPIELKEEELKALISFVEALKDGWMD